MRVDIYLPLLLAAAFGVLAPRLARRLPPAAATWLLSVGSLLCSTAATAALAFVGWTFVGQNRIVAAEGDWSTTVLRRHDLVAPPIAIIALLTVAAVSTRLAVTALRRVRALVDAYRLAASLPAHGGELVVLDDPRVPACAVPGWPGRIVVPTTLLKNLDAAGRRALLAHERAHLTHGHHWHQTAAALAATNPLLRATPAAVALACERWADEDAASATRRDAVATALRVAARTQPHRPPHGPVVLSAAADHVAARIAALSAPAPRPALWRGLILVGLIAATIAATGVAAHETEHLFELAMHTGRITGGTATG